MFEKIFGKIGGDAGWRSALLWRGFGLALIVGFLHDIHVPLQMHFRSFPLDPEIWPQYIASRSWPNLSLTACGFLMLFAGARMFAIAITAVVGCWELWSNAFDPATFPSAELPVFAFLPVLTVLAAVVAGDDDQLDETVCGIFRLGFLSSMFYAAFHKINSDFLNTSVSCVNQVEAWLIKAWGPYGQVLADIGSPWMTIISEAAIPIAIIVAPLFGIAFTALFMLPLGLIGATRIVVIMIVMSWAFLPRADGALIRRGLFGLTGSVATVSVVATLWSLAVYQDRYLSRELIGIIELCALGSVIVAGYLVYARRAGSESAEGVGAGPVPRGGAHRWVLVAAALVMFGNGFAPYVGMKFNYSFSMWSNLRVDVERWNHLLVPPLFGRMELAPVYVKVEDVEVRPRASVLLSPTPLHPRRFLSMMAQVEQRRETDIGLTVRYGGATYTSDDAFADPSVRRLLGQLRARFSAPEGSATGASAGAGAGGAARGDAEVVQVERLTASRRGEYERRYEKRIEPGWFSPRHLVTVAEDVARRGWTMDLQVRHDGVTRQFENAVENPAFRDFTAGLGGNNLWSRKRDSEGPQRCIH